MKYLPTFLDIFGPWAKDPWINMAPTIHPCRHITSNMKLITPLFSLMLFQNLVENCAHKAESLRENKTHFTSQYIASLGWEATTISSCMRWALTWVLGSISSWRRCLSIGTGSPWKWWISYLWRYLKIWGCGIKKHNLMTRLGRLIVGFDDLESHPPT